MRYIEIYNMNNILEYRMEVDKYQIGDLGLNFFTDGMDIDFDMFFKGIKEVDEMNKKVSYDINSCRGEEYFKIRLIDNDIQYACDKCILGMVQGDQIFFAPSIEIDNDGKTKSRYYISFMSECRIEYEL